MVAVYAHGEGFGEKPVAILNIFRIEDNQIIEHWEGIQQETEPTLDKNIISDEPTDVPQLDLSGNNRYLIKSFLNDVMIKREFHKLTNYIGKEQDIHHNIVGDDLGGVKGFKNISSMEYKTIHRTIADSNFVVSHSEGFLKGSLQQFFDIFRVQKGKIAEHWSVIQDVSAGSKNSNGIF